jgi:NAD/NADP transhydrogenase beta subunit
MRSPAQIWARLIGLTLVAAGAIGFFYSSSFGSPGHTKAVLGILDVNGFHNVVHIASGLVGLALAGSYGGARAYAIGLGVVYTAVAIWGFILGDGGAILSIVPVNTEDNVLHAVIAAVSLAVGFGSSAVPAPSTRGPGPGFRYN